MWIHSFGLITEAVSYTHLKHNHTNVYHTDSENDFFMYRSRIDTKIHFNKSLVMPTLNSTRF